MDFATGENEKQLLAATVRKRIIENKNFIYYREILDKKIPTFLKNYLQNSVQKFLHTEEPVQFNNSKRFDFEFPKITELKNALMKAVEEATIFSAEEITEIINKTVSLQFNLLVKPGPTLEKIFYKNKSDRVQNEIVKTLEGIDDHRLYIQSLIRNVKEFDQYHIVEEDFKNILHKTNKDAYEENLVEFFSSDVYAFANFLSMIHGYEGQKIEINLVKLLLNQRGLNQYAKAFDIYQETKIDVDKIASILTDFINNRSDTENLESDIDEINNFMKFSIADDQDKESIEQRSKLYKSENNQSIEGSGQPKSNAAYTNTNLNHEALQKFELENEKIHPKITNVWQDPLDMIITRSDIEKQPEGPFRSLGKLIDERDKKFIQKRIFDNDTKIYNEFIRQLESIDSWKEAKKVIDNELLMRSIEPYSKEALRLGDLVFNRYFPKKH